MLKLPHIKITVTLLLMWMFVAQNSHLTAETPIHQIHCNLFLMWVFMAQNSHWAVHGIVAWNSHFIEHVAQNSHLAAHVARNSRSWRVSYPAGDYLPLPLRSCSYNPTAQPAPAHRTHQRVRSGRAAPCRSCACTGAGTRDSWRGRGEDAAVECAAAVWIGERIPFDSTDNGSPLPQMWPATYMEGATLVQSSPQEVWRYFSLSSTPQSFTKMKTFEFAFRRQSLRCYFSIIANPFFPDTIFVL